MNNKQSHLATLQTMAQQYHEHFCVVRKGVPEKPRSERDICHKQIYEYARIHEIDPATVDALMDESERRYASYAPA